MIRKALAVICLTTIPFVFPAAVLRAQATGPSLPPVAGEFNEELREAALISGTQLVGLQRSGNAGGELSLQLAAPADWAGERICLRLISSNGRYEARARYDVPADHAGGVLGLQFPTTHARFLAELSGDGLAVLATRNGCDAPDPEFAIAVWNRGVGPVRLLLNSFRADEVFVLIDGGGQASCAPLTIETRSAYDTGCDLDLQAVHGLALVSVYRYVNQQATRPTQFRVWTP
ncbi:MAG: hypothetical protein KDK12_08750 [Rhodobacteraceae bacterium]|nr:hypothetical protein [Paracoccaceae bacterium]